MREAEEEVVVDLFEEGAPVPLAKCDWSTVALPHGVSVHVEMHVLAVWPSAMHVAHWLCEHPEAARGKSVCELGCGAGLPALASARLGASSVLGTDYDELATAALARVATWNGLDNLGARTVDWFGALAPGYAPPTFDLLIAADCIYYARAAPALVACARAMCHVGGRLLLASREDRVGLPEVLELLEAEGGGWRLESSAPFADDADPPAPASGDDARDSAATSGGGTSGDDDGAAGARTAEVSPRGNASRMWIYARV